MRSPFEDLTLQWRGAPGSYRIDDAMRAATVNVICRAFFTDFGELDAERVVNLMGRYVAPVSWIIAYVLLGLPSFTPHPGKLKMQRAAGEGRRLVQAFVARRRTKSQHPPDLAQTLIDAKDPETGRSLSDDDLVDMFLTLLAAGHETSANALTWALYCLAAQPEPQEALAARVREVVGDGPVEVTHLGALDEVRHFLQETMRLFPPAPRIARRALRDCQVGAELIRAGSLVFIPIYTIHRHRVLWSDPDVFDPARFSATSEQTRPRCAYMPFGAGPRICIGASFAMLEMLVGLATVLTKVRLRLGDPTPPQPMHRITLRPEHALVLRVEARN
jgi:cytochrome P450